MLVDVILPIYRGRRWVVEAIDSVLAQTYLDWHLTVVDDASPDETLDYVKEIYQDHADRISFIRLAQNHRAAGARMEAIRQTHGDLIAFIDQDDRWHPRKLERQVELLKRSPYVHAIHTDVQHIDSNGDVIPGSADRENAYRANIPYDTLKCQTLARQLFLMNSVRLVSAVVLRHAFEQAGGFDITLFGGEDWEFWVRFAASGHRITHIAIPLVDRRLHSSNTSQAYFAARTQGLLQTIDRVLLHYPDLSDLATYRRSLLLRREIVNGLVNGRGSQVRPRIRQFLRLGKGKTRIMGCVFWVLSLVGPFQRPLAMTGLRLIRGMTQQGWAIVSAQLIESHSPKHEGDSCS